MKSFKLIGLLSILLVSCHQEPDNKVSQNQTLETIMNRTSIRQYTDKEITDNEISLLLKAGMAAPSSRDRRPWHFVVISDRSILKSLGEQLKNAASLKDANKAIVVCGDINLSDNCWFLDCAASVQNILIAAQSMGIGAVWTAVFPYDDREAIVNETIQLPENVRALTVIPLGYPAGEHKARDKFDSSRIHHNKWQDGL